MTSEDKRLERLERRLNGMKRKMSELREENQELRKQLTMVHAYNAYMEDRLDDMNEKLTGYAEHFRRIHVNQDTIEELDLRLQGKVGNTDFNILEERVKQIQTQLNFLADYVDVDWELELDTEEIEQRTSEQA